jgi:hypothetical protein
MIEVIKQLVEALEWCHGGEPIGTAEAIKAGKQAIAELESQEPVAFKIYKPTPPRHAIPNVRDAELPWVYDQDPSSGNVASMWVTPVKHTHPPQRTEGRVCCQQYDICLEPCTSRGRHLAQRTWVGLTDEEICMFSMWLDSKPDATVFTAIEAKLKEKNT